MTIPYGMTGFPPSYSSHPQEGEVAIFHENQWKRLTESDLPNGYPSGYTFGHMPDGSLMILGKPVYWRPHLHRYTDHP